MQPTEVRHGDELAGPSGSAASGHGHIPIERPVRVLVCGDLVQQGPGVLDRRPPPPRNGNQSPLAPQRRGRGALLTGFRFPSLAPLISAITDFLFSITDLRKILRSSSSMEYFKKKMWVSCLST